MNAPKGKAMSDWFWYGIGAAILYGMHQVFTAWLLSVSEIGWAASWWKAPLP